MNAYEATRRFEQALCEYTGSPYAVAVSSCTAALELCLAYVQPEYVRLPKRTYVGVAQVAYRLTNVFFIDKPWKGAYCLEPTRIWDSAKRFTEKMYIRGQFQCLSFHAAKILGDTQGGAILHDDPKADAWFRRARFDGRSETIPLNEDTGIILGYHCYMSPDVAARLHLRLTSHSFPKTNPDQWYEGFLEKEYGDLSTLACFKDTHVRARQ